VEQEILFHLAGYNGELYQQLYFDFRELIREINRKAGKQLIKIKYFDSVKIEIDKFFKIFSSINIPLNIGIWVMALISFINGTINCNAILFYVLFGINAFLTITKIPKMLKDEEDKKTQTEPVKNE
jgi:uncharacterized membrane protein YuzA (DUF378 family)